MISCEGAREAQEHMVTDSVTVRVLATGWNDAISKKDSKVLPFLYAPEVLYYGKKLVSRQVLEQQQQFFKTHPDYLQLISDTLNVARPDAKRYKVSFEKTYSFGKRNFKIPAFLVFEKQEGAWRITEEGDIGAAIEVGDTTSTKQETCSAILVQMLMDTKQFKQKTEGLTAKIQANGGSSFGVTLEASPNPSRDEAINQSETYDFNLHESYPDRAPVIARYTFDPRLLKLFEYDMVADSLLPIEYDKRYLKNWERLCK